MTMSSRVLTTLGVVLCALAVTVAAAAAPVTAATTAQAHPQQSQPPVEGEIDIDPRDLPGDGSESNPYEISNVSELQAMEDDLDANYELVSDIDASQTAQFNDGAGFDPIGSESTPFIGSLDGNSRTVTSLTINRSTEENVGLFGVCVGELTEVTLTNATVTGNEAVGRLVGSVSGDSLLQEIRVSGKVSGDKDVGGIVGVATGSSTLRNVTASGEVKSTQDQNVGGLVGFNDGTIQDATASGDVIGGPFNTGGLVGDNNGNLTSVTATTDVSGIEDVGGVVGENNGGTIQNATASGNVTAEGSVGGLVGRNDGTIRESFAVGPVAGDFRVGGLVGLNTVTVEQSYFDTEATGQTTSAGSATGLTTAQMQGQAAAENMNGFDFENTWTTTSEYPALRVLSEADKDSGSGSGSGGEDPIQVDVDPSDFSGDGSESNPYEISNVSELQAMEDDLDANYEVVSDIDASQTAQFNDGAGFDPVGNSGSEFNGSLDGNDHTVTGLRINRSDNSDVGLFGVTGNGAILTDVTVTEIAVTGKNNVGGIVGFNDGTITASSAGGNLSGSNQVGGLVGFNRGTIQRAQTSVDMTALGTGGDDVGGLVGFNIGTIRRAQASGNVTAIGTPGDDVGGVAGSNGGTLRNATASGNVSGTEEVGGVAGSNDGTVRAAIASGSVTGTDVVGGLIGSNTGTITNVTASGNVTGIDEVGGVVGDNTGVITASTGAGNVNGSDGIGGLVGDNDGEGTDDGIISRSTASGEVTGGDKVGGLVGSNLGGEINLSVATGSVIIQSSQTDNSFPRAGGLVGGNFRGGVINQSYAKTVVSGGGNERRIGGLVGENFNQTGSDPSRILNSYASGPLSGSNQGEVGGLVGGNFRASRVVDSYWDTEETEQSTSAGSATGLTTAQMQGRAAKTNMSGFEFGVDWQTQTDPPDYPVLISLQQGTDTPTPTPTPTQNETSETVNVSDGQATATFPPGQSVSKAQVSDLPGDVSSVTANVSSTNPSTGSGSLPGNVSTFINITPQDNDGNVEDVTQEVTVSVVVEESTVRGINDPTLYHDLNSSGTYRELDTQVSEVSNGIQLTATTTGLSPFAVAEATPPTSIVDKFDTDGNGEISITELGQAGRAFASGELTITELGEVGAAFASE